MTETHLTEERHRRLLAGELPPAEAAALAAHLDAPCPACEAFLEGRPAGPLDGAVDAALLGLAPPGARAAGNDLEYHRVLRRLAVAAPEASPRPAPRRPGRLRAAGGLAAAAALVVALGVVERVDRERHPSWTGEKGSAAATPVRLRFLVEEGERLEKGVTGQAVSSGARLRFELELAHDARVTLVRVPAAGEPEVVHEAPLRAGTTLLTVDGAAAAYPLDGLAGTQGFVAVAVASAGRLAPREAVALATGAAPAGPASLDRVEVTVH